MRLPILIFLLLVTLGINSFVILYSNAAEKEVVVHEPDVKAVEVAEDTSRLSPEPTKSKLEILFTGDVMLGRTVMTTVAEKNDHRYPFRKTAQRLSEADLTIINLENPVIENCPVHTGGFRFCSEPESVKGLIYAGVDIANLANNHTYNWGEDGFEQTVGYLSQSDIDVVGYDNVVYKDVDGVIFAFMGFDFVTNPYELSSQQVKMISEADERSDILVINVHWGNEYKSSANQHQRSMAEKFIDLGADLIVGHHPHWVQDVECFVRSGKLEDWDWKEIEVVGSISAEELKNGDGCDMGTIPVYYSLGNFVFDQMWSEETKKGIAVKVNFENGEYSGHEVYPTYMKDWAQPVWVE